MMGCSKMVFCLRYMELERKWPTVIGLADMLRHSGGSCRYMD